MLTSGHAVVLTCWQAPVPERILWHLVLNLRRCNCLYRFIHAQLFVFFCGLLFLVTTSGTGDSSRWWWCRRISHHKNRNQKRLDSYFLGLRCCGVCVTNQFVWVCVSLVGCAKHEPLSHQILGKIQVGIWNPKTLTDMIFCVINPQ